MKAVAAGRQESSLQSQNREDAERRNKKESKKEKKKRNSHGCISMFCMYIPLVSMRSDALPCAMCTVC